MIALRSLPLLGLLMLAACGGGGGGGDGNNQPPAPTGFTVTGTITAAAGTLVDSDVNDSSVPSSLFKRNNDAVNAQTVPNPVTVGGYVNLPNTGAAGRLQGSGDTSDFFRVDALAGQVITLIIGDTNGSDADLYLFDTTGNTMVASSVGTNAFDTITINQPNQYLIEVRAIAGATNYTLSVGQGVAGADMGTLSSSAEFVPYEAVVELVQSTETSGEKALAAMSSMQGMSVKAGAPGRPMLVSMSSQTFLAASADRPASFATPQLQAMWETAMAIKAMRSDPAVKYAEPNYIRRATAIPNDQFYNRQWHYGLVNLPAATDIPLGQSNVTVAVIDSGVLLGHPDLQGQLTAGYDFIRDANRAGDNDGIDPNANDEGDNGANSVFHGTHVAGTIAAATNNTIGVAGVAAGAKIMPLRALGTGGGTSYDIAQAVSFAAGLQNDSGTVPAKRADVINLSLGGGGASQAEQTVYTNARNQGVVIVAAAGNSNTNVPSYPASYDGVISVSAVNIRKLRASYSNFGATIDVAAPGGDSGDVDGDGFVDGVLSTSGNKSTGTTQFGYLFLRGTSMASPHMAGVVALMKAANSALTPGMVDQLLSSQQITEDLGTAGFDTDFGNGLIDARKAILAAQGANPPTTPTLAATPRALNFRAQDSALDMVISNAGGGTLQVTSVTTSTTSGSPASWLTVSPVTVDATTKVGRYLVTVSRIGMAEGTYSAQINIASNAGNAAVPVMIQVSNAPMASNIGLLYILLVNPDTDQVVKQTAVAATDGTYEFTLSNVANGTYELLAGSDNDGDLVICDGSEACGGYITFEQRTPITVDGDKSGMDFTAGYDVSITTQSSGSKRQEIKRLAQ